MQVPSAKMIWRSPRGRVGFISLTIFVLVTGVVLAGSAFLKTQAISDWLVLHNHPMNTVMLTAQEKPPLPRATIFRIVLRKHGFEPSEITLSEGRYLFSVDNRTELDSILFQLNRNGQGKLHETISTKEKAEWSRVFDLSAGNYQLSVAGKPNWVSNITVTK